MEKRKIDHNNLIDLLLKNSPDFTSLEDSYFSPQDRENLKKSCFLNNYTLQLTHLGFKFFSSIFQCYRIDFPEKYKLRSNDLITLDRECQLPYYIKCKRRTGSDNPEFVALFEKELALILKLYDCDLDMIRNMPRDSTF